MNKITAAMAHRAILLAAVAWCLGAESSQEDARAIAKIESVGGKISVDEEIPGKPVIGVDYRRDVMRRGACLHGKEYQGDRRGTVGPKTLHQASLPRP